MRKRRFAQCAFALALAASMAVPVGAAFADDGIEPYSTEDTAFTFTFASKGATQGTEGRTKDTSSSTYIYIKGRSGNTVRMYVDGASGSHGTWYDRTNAPAYSSSTGEYEIHNTVYEAGYKWARLTGWAYLGPASMYGVWSPDCAGNYPDMN